MVCDFDGGGLVLRDQCSSLLALVSILGLAVSLAVKDSLSNLAGGLTILGTKPFKVGDYVQIDDIEGTVQDIGLVYTQP